MEDYKRKSKSSSFSKKKKSGQAKSKSLSKRPSSTIKRRKRKSKVIHQRSVEDVHCFNFPFIDFLCGCNNNGKKERERIKKISSKHVSQSSKKSKEFNSKCDSALQNDNEKENSKINIEKEEIINQSNNDSPLNDPSASVPKGLSDPIPLQNLRVNSSMKQILANVKLTSLFGCPNVPKSMSQIKILLDNNPSLKKKLKDILGENLKNESMKTIADLLASDKSGSETSVDTTFKKLAQNKDVSENNITKEESNLSSDVMSKKTHKEEGEKKKHFHKSSRHHSSKSISKYSHKKKLDNEDNQSMFSKIMSTVFGSSKSNNNKGKSKDSSKISFISSKIKFDSQSISPHNEEKTREMREKYDEWFKNAPNDVRERFRWEDYVRVTMYLNDNSDNCSKGDKETNSLLNRWLKSFSNEMNGNKHVKDDEKSKFHLTNIENENVDLGLKANFEDPNEFQSKLIFDSEKGMITRIKSYEMLNKQDKEGGDRIVRLNSLMKELLDRSCSETPFEEKHKGDGEDVNHLSQPGCSNWSISGRKSSEKYQEEESLDQMRVMCASFVEKLTEHKSREITKISRPIPWQNKDFQVFCLPYIENSPFTIFKESTSFSNLSRESGAYGDGNIDILYTIDDPNIKDKPLSGSKFMEDNFMQPKIFQRRKSTESINTYGNPNENLSSNSTELSSVKNGYLNPENKCSQDVRNELKHSNHQKKVWFENDSVFEYISNSEKVEKEIDSSKDPSSSGGECQNEDLFSQSNSEELERLDRQYENEKSSSETYTSSSSYSDKNKSQQDQMSISTRHSMDKETIKYIEEHQSEIIDILKQLVSLSNLNPNFFQQAEEFSNKLTEMNTKKECIGIQCTLSLDDKSNYSSNRLKSAITIAKNGSIGIKSDLYNIAKSIRSEYESSESDSIRLNSSSSDSGVHSKSSSCRRFSSLPDVLEGAAAIATCEKSLDMSSKENEDIERKQSTGSNASSTLSTSISCQASQTPVSDDLSQVSSSDMGDKISSLLECKASYFNINIDNASSEKSQSSENTMGSNNSNVVRTKIKRLLKILKK